MGVVRHCVHGVCDHAHACTIVSFVVEEVIVRGRIAAVAANVLPPKAAVSVYTLCESLGHEHEGAVSMACPPA